MLFELFEDVFNCFSVDIITLIIGITVCIELHRLLSGNRFNPPLPPSPTLALPVIGHLHLVSPDMRIVFRKYRRQLGDVYSLHFGQRHVIVIAGYESLKEALINQGDNFSDRPSLYLTDKMTRKSGVAMTSGPVWKEHRRFCLSNLKDFGMGKSVLETKIHEEVNALLKSLQDNCGKPFNPRTLITTHVANIISSIVFKGHYQDGDARILKLITIFDERMESIAGIAGLANFMPWLAKIPGDPLKVNDLIHNANHLFEYAFEIIADHEQEYTDNDIGDLTSAYIHEMKRLHKAGEHTTMSYEHLSAVIADLFIAGSHTTAIAISWAIVCLVTYPHIQERLFDSVATVIGTERLPSIQDKPQLVYLEAFYLEVLRYCNLANAGGPRTTSHDLIFKGFTIPKDAIILCDMDSVLTDESIWGDPAIFRPERFIDDEGNIKKIDEMMVFFIGKRSCPGESLARMELLVFLGALLQNFKFESCSGETLTIDKVDGVFGFVHSPKPYNVLVTPR